MKNEKYGLLGEKLGHSYSPIIHKFFADYEYNLYEVAKENVEDFIMNGDYRGLNVTIPYKKTVMPFCSELSDIAKRIGSVNTLVKRDDGSIYGHNSDYYGFCYMVKKSGICFKDKKVLILGNGGACAMVKVAADDLGASSVVVISRRGEDNYTNINKHKDADIIVNTTPVGMYPNVDESPLDLEIFDGLCGVLDIIYNPEETKLLKQARKLDIKHINGLSMLVAQAKESCEKFIDINIDDKRIEEYLQSKYDE